MPWHSAPPRPTVEGADPARADPDGDRPNRDGAAGAARQGWGAMKTTIPLGRLAGIAVGAHWSVLVTVVLLVQLLAMVVLPGSVPGQVGLAYWATAAGGALLFLVSLLAHELAHALVARRYGVDVQRITLWLLGGVAQLEGEPPTPRADLLIAGVGPVVSLGLGGLFALAAAGATA